MRKLKIAVLMGGPSAEREVSLRSGTAVANALAATGAKVVPMDIQDATFTIPADMDVVLVAFTGRLGKTALSSGCLRDEWHRVHGIRSRGQRAGVRQGRRQKHVPCVAGIPTPKYEAFLNGQSDLARDWRGSVSRWS